MGHSGQSQFVYLLSLELFMCLHWCPAMELGFMVIAMDDGIVVQSRNDAYLGVRNSKLGSALHVSLEMLQASSKLYVYIE
jgi:hypothetical protein